MAKHRYNCPTCGSDDIAVWRRTYALRKVEDWSAGGFPATLARETMDVVPDVFESPWPLTTGVYVCAGGHHFDAPEREV